MNRTEVEPGARAAPVQGARRSAARTVGVALVLCAAVVLDLLACRATGIARVPPVAPRASLAFADGRVALLAGDDAAARSAFTESLRLAPDWAAPARALDDLDRDALLGPDLLTLRRTEVAESESALGQYLLGRLEGPAGVARFRRGIELDGDLAWNHHGVAWNLFAAGAARAALRPGRLAHEAARDTWERSFFTIALVRYELALGRAARAIDLLEERLAERDVLSLDRDPLEAWLAQAEMMLGEPGRAAQGRSRGLALLANGALPEEDLARLFGALRASGFGAGASWGGSPAGGEALELELAGALAGRDEPLARRLRASLMLDLERPALALALLADDDEPSIAADPRLRTARFARGGGRAAIAAWVEALPEFVKDARGAPRDPLLARLALAARDGDDRELAAALIAAGWFAEGHAFAEDLAERDGKAALALEARAGAGLVLVDGVARVLDLVDRGEPYGGAFARVSGEAADPAGPRFTPPDAPEVIDSLDDLLAALQPLFFAYVHAPGGPEPRDVDLASSPRATYGPAATVVHPGPVYSADDARNGLGAAGAPVAGLASELAAIGRFGIFGEAIGGGGPDGTLLRRVLVEERSGEHLGVPWHGLVAWCDGADVESRPGRRGAQISGAALHEGYWVDLDVVRGELVAWDRLAERFLGPDADPELARRALAVRGIPSAGGPGAPEAWAALVPLLGEADRVRLAVLLERGPERRVTLEELASLTALHEEGHLTDRTRFLPLSANLGAVLRFALDAGLSPGGIARALEERAQLVALCDAPDPRMPLADVLAGAELGSSVTPHGAAYRALLERWLATLADLAADRERFSALDGERVLAHQLHRLTPDEVRTVSRELARRRGLVRD